MRSSLAIERPEGNPSLRVVLPVAGVAAGGVLAFVLFAFFDPVNLFALRLQEATVGTQATGLSVGITLAFVSGATMIFTPCGLPLVFTLNSTAWEGRETGRVWVAPLALFSLGITAVMAVWGAIVGSVGGAIVDLLSSPSRLFTTTSVLYSLLGAFALLMALWELGWVRLPRLGGRGVPARVAKLSPHPRSLAMGAAVGGGFGIGCPFPTYQAILAWAAVVGNPLYGAVLLAANALGRTAPLWAIGALAYQGTDQRAISRWLVGSSARAKLINGTALAALAGLMLVLWGGLVPFVLKPGG